MNQLYYTRVDRRDFGDLLSGVGLGRLNIEMALGYQLLESPGSNAVIAVWSQNPKETGQLPHLLICREGTATDWAAWVTTFVAKIRPFSAYMRLITETDLRRFAEATRTPDLGRLAWPMAGLVLGEVLAASGLPDKALDTLSATACASTLSFVMFRAAAAYKYFDQWDELVEAWESVRLLAKQRSRPLDGASVARVCATLLSTNDVRVAERFVSPGDRYAFAACREFISSPRSAPSPLSGIPHFIDAERMMHGPRENRVVAFEGFISQLERMPREDSELISFAVGYLASRIAPGTIRHYSVLAPVTRRYPTVALWYGFCAGFGEAETDPGGRQGLDLPTSARRIVRDLLRTDSVLDAPVCDIGFLELAALSRTTATPLDGLITTTPGTAVIELAPCVWTSANVSSKPVAEAVTRTARERNTIAAIGQQIERLQEMYRDLIRSDPPVEAHEQTSWFSPRRKN